MIARLCLNVFLSYVVIKVAVFMVLKVVLKVVFIVTGTFILIYLISVVAANMFCYILGEEMFYIQD